MYIIQVFAWDTISSQCGESIGGMPIVFENVNFERPKTVSGQLLVSVKREGGKFEVLEENGGTKRVLVRGRLRVPAEPLAPEILPSSNTSLSNSPRTEASDLYKYLRLQYGHVLDIQSQTILSVDLG